MERSHRWNPWRTLRSRPDVLLEWAELDCRGLVEAGPPPKITIDPRLGRIDRRCVLGHEVTHVELELWWPPGTPAGIVQAGERVVRRRTAERFVPLDELAEWARAQAEVEPVTARMIAEEFDVNLEVALEAVALHGHRNATTEEDL